MTHNNKSDISPCSSKRTEFLEQRYVLVLRRRLGMRAASNDALTLLTYKSTYPSAIKSSLVNFLRNQLKRGLAIRKEILDSNEKSGAVNVLTQCIFQYEAFDAMNSDDMPQPNVVDYCIYFTYLMIEAFVKNKKCVVNKSN